MVKRTLQFIKGTPGYGQMIYSNSLIPIGPGVRRLEGLPQVFVHIWAGIAFHGVQINNLQLHGLVPKLNTEPLLPPQQN